VSPRIEHPRREATPTARTDRRLAQYRRIHQELTEMPTRHEIVELCDTYCRAVSSRDLDAIMNLFADDARQYEPIGTEPRVGKAAIREFFASTPPGRLTLTRFGPVTVSGRHAAMQVTVNGELGGPSFRFTTTDVIEFGDDGRIISISALPDQQAVPLLAGDLAEGDQHSNRT
jgi:steroid delta-isomerase